jgi:hypothetical protein
MMFLLEKDGKRSAYVMTGKYTGLHTNPSNNHSGKTEYYVVAAYVKALYDMSNCTDIDRAKVFTSSYAVKNVTPSSLYGNNSQRQPELWYAAGNKIYTSVLPTTNTGEKVARSKLVFTFPEEEEVTHMIWMKEACTSTGGSGYIFWNYDQNGVPTYPKDYSTNNMMTVATWNESTEEGRVYAIPRMFPGTGVLLNSPTTPENQFVLSVGGFGKITAICLRNN